MNKIITSAIFLVLFAATACQTEETPIIPLNKFFTKPVETDYRISPDGKYYVYTGRWKGNYNIYLTNTETKKNIQITFSDTADIKIISWAGSSFLVFSSSSKNSPVIPFYSYSLSDNKSLLINNENHRRLKYLSDIQKRPGEILILSGSEGSEADVYSLNLNTREFSLEFKNSGGYVSFIPNNEGKIRCYISSDGINSRLYLRDDSGNAKVIYEYDYKSELMPLNLSADEKTLYMISNKNTDTKSLVAVNIVSGKDTILYENKNYDLENVLYSCKNDKILAGGYIENDFSYRSFSEEFDRLGVLIKKKLNKTNFKVVNFTDDETKFVISVNSDKKFEDYYLADTRESRVTLLNKKNIDINPDHLVEMKPIAFKTDKGFSISGYIALPKGKMEDLPFVIVPHGGPYMRDVWKYRAEVQFFANRGYGVLLINYRGSTGFGKKFMHAGNREWGGKIQKDIASGVKWIIGQGLADPKRIGIYGYSFGGYSALMNLILYPELYKCGVSYAGVMDLNTLLEDVPDWSNFKFLISQLIGDPYKEKEKLSAESPLYNVTRIQDPVFIAHGMKDEKVKYTQVSKMIMQLDRNNKTVEYLLKNNEGHIFRDSSNVIELYTKVEKFFKKHLAQNDLK